MSTRTRRRRPGLRALRRSAPASAAKPRDARYSTARWQKVRRLVLDRDRWACFVPGCGNLGNVADHIEPATLDMSDALFYSPRNLRASCYGHNRARAWGLEFGDRKERP